MSKLVHLCRHRVRLPNFYNGKTGLANEIFRSPIEVIELSFRTSVPYRPTFDSSFHIPHTKSLCTLTEVN